MNLLAFDTSTDTMSIAVCRTVQGRTEQWLYTGAGGAKASTGLIGGAMDLLAQAGLELAGLDAVCFGAGPGSFTGLRTACSVAQGLAFGANLPVLPVDTLLAVAEEARFGSLAAAVETMSTLRVTAMLDARMEEMYVASYDYADGLWQEVQPSHLVRPEVFAARSLPSTPLEQHWLAGNVFAEYRERLADSLQTGIRCITALPTAAAMLRLAPALLAAGKAVSAEHALPAYIRDKVAKTTAERMAEKAEKAEMAGKAGNAAQPSVVAAAQ
jgi:tRNA threonylcarbamoyladenosine biosynthesis protein TsaB